MSGLPQAQFRGYVRRERGQSLIEFAMLFPLLLLFIAILVVFALMLHTRSNLQQAVREGARQAAVGKSLAEVRNLAAANSNSSIDPLDVQWCHPIDTDGTRGEVGDSVRVFIAIGGVDGPHYEYNLTPGGGALSSVFGMSASVPLAPVATARLERSVPASELVDCP